MRIHITNSLLEKLPDFHIEALKIQVEVQDSKHIDDLINQTEQNIKEEYSLEEVLNIPLIKEARDSYKLLGKDPSRTRLACESLLRRIVKGNSLYRINDIVDMGNILSIQTKRSTALMDINTIRGDVFIRIGTTEDRFDGIGRGSINVDKIPIYVDDVGPFGSPTSDAPRTMIQATTKEILLMIICFGPEKHKEHKKLAKDLFADHCKIGLIEDIEVVKMR